MCNSMTHYKFISCEFNLGKIEIFLILLSVPVIKAYLISFMGVFLLHSSKYLLKLFLYAVFFDIMNAIFCPLYVLFVD